ncbi:MAG: response regulator [Candidatus Scalindua sp.]|jgi:DNA-binding NtrC family response regulator|nr:response regulator [Candidatus Scalindua sp.]MDV5167230.1 response regulator [Candidatus Scalindua sp.]
MKEIFRILIVDDNPGVRESLSDILVVSGYNVEIAETGSKAIDLSKINRYDIIIVDISLPDLSGIKVVEKIARISPTTEFMYMTGQASVDSAIEVDMPPFFVPPLKLEFRIIQTVVT